MKTLLSPLAILVIPYLLYADEYSGKYWEVVTRSAGEDESVYQQRLETFADSLQNVPDAAKLFS